MQGHGRLKLRGIGQEIGQLLSVARRSSGKTQAAAALVAQVDEIAVRRWERGERVPSAEHVERLVPLLLAAVPVHDAAKPPPMPMPGGHPIRTFLVEDDDTVRADLVGRLQAQRDMEVVGEASSMERALQAIKACSPLVVTIDLRLGPCCGLDLAESVLATLPAVKVLILSGYDYPQYVRRAARIGVHAYLRKDAEPAELLDAIRRISINEPVLPLHIASQVLGGIVDGIAEPPVAYRLRCLSTREMETLELLCAGLTNDEIAREVSLSPRTIEEHVTGILRKLGLSRRSDLGGLPIVHDWVRRKSRSGGH